jgi:type 1 fimbriae regulatory protein FimE
MTRKSNVVARKRRSPIAQNGKVSLPKRVPNTERRSREHLTPAEVEKVSRAAGKVGRHWTRDAALITLMYRHGFRVSEAVTLRWSQLDLKQGLMHVNRFKNGVPSTHPLRGPELRALRQLQRDYPSAYVFSTERGGPMTTSAVRKLVARAGELANLSLPIHPHMLRHACGYKLANDGHEHSRATTISRAQEHPAHGAIYGTCARPVQELLARLRANTAEARAALGPKAAFPITRRTGPACDDLREDLGWPLNATCVASMPAASLI